MFGWILNCNMWMVGTFEDSGCCWQPTVLKSGSVLHIDILDHAPHRMGFVTSHERCFRRETDSRGDKDLARFHLPAFFVVSREARTSGPACQLLDLLRVLRVQLPHRQNRPHPHNPPKLTDALTPVLPYPW
jgi:hypothetical protein